MKNKIWNGLALACALLASGITGSALAGDEEVIRLSEPIEVTDTHEVFGSPLPESPAVLEIADLLENSEKYQDTDVLVSTRIAKVCQKKGCFFIAQHGADSVRVSFEKYSFFIPTDSGGKTVLLAGTFSRKPLSQEEADHFAEDLGEEAPETVPEFQYAIVATGVSIPKS